MEIHFVIADPAGNITAIVKDGVADDDYRSVAAAIMQDPQWKVEQVGFITEPKVGGEARLQMMGGEFCGNAARSFGKYIAKKMRRQEAVIEISGNSAPMRIETDPARGSAKAQMPCPLKIDELSVGLGSSVVFEVEEHRHHFYNAPHEYSYSYETYDHLSYTLFLQFPCLFFGSDLLFFIFHCFIFFLLQ